MICAKMAERMEIQFGVWPIGKHCKALDFGGWQNA